MDQPLMFSARGAKAINALLPMFWAGADADGADSNENALKWYN